MKCNQIYPPELMEQAIALRTEKRNVKKGLVLQIAEYKDFDPEYSLFFDTNRKYIIPDAEGMEIVDVFHSVNGMKVFGHIFPYLYLIEKELYTPAYLDIVTNGENYKRQIEKVYGCSFLIWDNHRFQYEAGYLGTKPSLKRKNDAEYILAVLEAIEEYMYTQNKLVSKFNHDYMKVVFEKRRTTKWWRKRLV